MKKEDEDKSKAGISNYLNSADRIKQRPRNEFEHAAYVLEEDEQDLIREFNRLVDKQIMLANIKDVKLMNYYQTDIFYLVQMLSESLRDQKFQGVFLTMYYTWKNQLKLTRAMGGGERAAQMAVVANYSPEESKVGYEMLPPDEQKEQNFIQKLFKRKKKQ